MPAIWCLGSTGVRGSAHCFHTVTTLRSESDVFVCRWVPVKERSRSLALVYSGMYTGSIFGLALSPHMVEVLSWPSVFYIFGAVGIVWYFIWQSQAASSPAADPAISAEERSYIEETSVLAVSLAHFSQAVHQPRGSRSLNHQQRRDSLCKICGRDRIMP